MSDFGPPVIWIQKRERLPDTCIGCGMFTDHQVNAKAMQQHQRTVSAGESNSMVALGCLLHLLGPVGWILAAILHSGSDSKKTTEKTVTTKGKIKVPCCRLCAGHRPPEPVEANIATGQYAFEAHARFVERLNTLRREAAMES